MILKNPALMTPVDRNEILRRFAQESIGDIATSLGCHRSTVEQVIRDGLWGIAELNKRLMETNARLEMNDPRHGESLHEFFKD